MTTDQNNRALAVRTDESFVKALEPNSFEAALKCAEVIHKAGIGGVKSPEDALVRLMAGRAQGMCAIDSLRLVYVINGKPGFDATFIRAKCLRHPECEYFEPVPDACDATKMTFRAKRRGRDEVKISFGAEDAKNAKLHEKDNYKHWATDMYAARATARLARLVFPEVTAGMYTPDELSEAIDTTGEVVHEPPTVQQVDELTGEVIEQAAHAEVVDHEKIATDIRAEIDAAKASGDRQLRAAVVEKIKNADLPAGLAASVKEYYKSAFANGAKPQAAQP